MVINKLTDALTEIIKIIQDMVNNKINEFDPSNTLQTKMLHYSDPYLLSSTLSSSSTKNSRKGLRFGRCQYKRSAQNAA